MAAPNMVQMTSIIGKSSFVSLTTTGRTTFINNPASSGKVYKVNMVQVSNVDGTVAADITIDVHDATFGGGTAYSLAKTVSVPADASLVVIDKNTAIYLEENTSMTAIAGSASDLMIVASYEEIS
jgi:hypothetical protein